MFWDLVQGYVTLVVGTGAIWLIVEGFAVLFIGTGAVWLIASYVTR